MRAESSPFVRPSRRPPRRPSRFRPGRALAAPSLRGLAALCAVALSAGCWLDLGGATKSASISKTAALEASDPELANGEHYDAYPLTAALGETIAVDLVSQDFDPYLILISPSGLWYENDDHEESQERSHLEVVAEESGEWTVYATSFEAAQVGRYRLSIDASPSRLPGHRFERGTLAEGDNVLLDGEWADRLTFAGEQGRYVWIDLRSRDFDPYLVLRGPGGERWENDDHEHSLGRSALGLTLPQSGEYEVIVTSVGAGEIGDWDLTLRDDLRPEAVHRVAEGELGAGDVQLRSGELVDEYEVVGAAGQRLRLLLSSPDFDGYLILVDPEGNHLENDDDDDGNSSLRTRLSVPGTHRILVTSYEAEQSGSYTLSIDLDEEQPEAEVAELELGGSRRGSLEAGDDELPQGEYLDRYAFHAEAGTPVEIVLASTDFDTYLRLVMPDGTSLESDDDWDDASRSRLVLTLPRSGEYELDVTSYGVGEKGGYQLDLRRPADGVVPPVRGAPNRAFALLVGIGDYGGRISNLDDTVEDARQLGRALVEHTDLQPEDSILLLDDEATADRFRESVSTLAARMTPADQLLIFYSGHGGRVRRDRYQAADPDSVDETLSLYDRELVDDELGELLGRVPGRVLLVLDSCFAGGFAKDVISVPGRMGLFSSEEDVTSSVADKFKAGGFLAAFLVDALAGDWADDGDRSLTTLELSYYLHERYRTDVKGGGPEDFVRTDGPQLGHQHLVVDRGSLGPADVLFRLR